MTEHLESSIPPAGSAVETGDHGDRPNRHWQILGVQCPDALDRLREYDRYRYEERELDKNPPSDFDDAIVRRRQLEASAPGEAQVLGAAKEVLACVQREFRSRADAPLEPRDAGELWRARHYALGALITLKDNRYAKRAERSAAGGHTPLTVCIGTRSPRWATTKIGRISVSFSGCLRVFEDVPHQRGEMWPVWCDRCKNDTAKPVRDQQRNAVGAINRWAHGDDYPMPTPVTRAQRRSRDSSKTRVQPVFHRLVHRDGTGGFWLQRLLELPEHPDRDARRATESDPGVLEVFDFEARLKPPISLLRWLIENPTDTPPRDYGTRSAQVRQQRELLVAGDLGTRNIALDLLASNGFRERAWYVLEGRTAIDLLLVTNRMTILIEGKRTERRPTTATSWMPVREQMLRNIDAAWDTRGDRQIASFYIVGDDNSTSLPPTWRRAIENTVSPTTVTNSLPHRSAAEREAIAQSFLGATTWGRICEELGIDYDILPDRI